MLKIEVFPLNPFSENTILLYDDGTGDCIIFDPGCYDQAERKQLQTFIEQNKLRPTRLINTHCHLDHVFGNAFVKRTWGLPLEAHRNEIPVLGRFVDACRMFGIAGAEPSPNITVFIEAGDVIELGQYQLTTLLTPGHSPGSLVFYCAEGGFAIGGDVLFYESIGRTDLPGGDMNTLLGSIRTQLFALPGATVVYPGHGPTTTIRHEMEYNPFL